MQYIIFGIFFTVLAADIFFFTVSSDFRYLFLAVLWIIIVKYFKFRSDMTFKLALGILSILFVFFIFFRESSVIEKLATWVYLTLLIGVLQQLVEFRNRK